MKITIQNLEGATVDIVDSKTTTFIAFISFLREWTLYDDFTKVMEYVDKDENLMIKAKFKVEWP